MDQLHHHTLLHRTRYKSLPSPQGLAAGGFASFFTAVGVYGFKRSNVVLNLPRKSSVGSPGV